MKIKLNEREIEVKDNTKLFDVVSKTEYDVIILNGHLCNNNYNLKAQDEIYFFNKNKSFTDEELELFLTARHTPAIQNKLKNAKIAVAGLGGLGSHIAVSFARMGIGHLKLMDFDIVDPTNIHRQYYFLDQIGMFKTDALEQNLKRINPFIDYEFECIKINEENIKTLFHGYDFLMEALDNAKAKTMLINGALTNYPKLTVIAASGVAGFDDIEKVHTKKLGKNLFVVGDFINETKPGIGLTATRVTAIANMQAHIAIRKLIGEL